MKLILESKLPKGELEISHQSSLMSIGSCFADSVGKELDKDGFDIEINPLGILFDPISIRTAVDEEQESLFLERDLSYYSLGFHSSIYGESEIEIKEKIAFKRLLFREKLEKAEVLFVTFGTSWVHKHLETDSFVANCHKLPAEQFNKELIDLDSERENWSKLINKWAEINPNLKIVFTVSPVRHSKNGLHENNVSKALLHLLVHSMVDKFDNVFYFPSYEIVLDELRDYRFFNQDLVHPTQQAIDYVYEKFSESYYSNKTKEACNIKRKLNHAQNHRFMNASREQELHNNELIKKLEQQFQDHIK